MIHISPFRSGAKLNPENQTNRALSNRAGRCVCIPRSAFQALLAALVARGIRFSRRPLSPGCGNGRAKSHPPPKEFRIMALEKLGNIDPAEKAFSLWNEFKAFAFKGNVIDMAVGVIIGTSFGAIVKSLVDHIIMPVVSVVMPSKEGYAGWRLPFFGAQIPVGEFLANVVNFLIIALVLYIFIVKFLGWITQSKKQEAAAPPPPTKDQELLTEIRDLLKAQKA